MPSRHRKRIIPPSSLLISYLASVSNAAFTNDFSAYPQAARSCLDTAAAASGCTGNTVKEMNTCLCGNGGNFVLATASCVEKTAKDELDDVYEMLLTSCTDSQTPLGVSQAQFLDPEDDDDTKSTSSHSSTTTFSTSTTMPPSAASTSQSMTTYKSVAPGGVTVTVTQGIASIPTGTSSGKQGSTGEEDQSSNPDEGGGSSKTALAAGVVGGVAVLAGVLAFLCYRRRKQRKERAGQVGTGGKFAALSSATSLTTMSASPPQGQATTAYNGANDLRPGTAHTMQMAAGTAQWNQQHQQQGQQSPQHWQNNAASPYGQHGGTWPSPVANADGPTGTWGVSPVSQYPPGSSGGGSPSSHRGTWNAQAVPAAVPAPHPSHPTNNAYAPVFELAGDETMAVEADSTPIGHAQPAMQPPSRSIQSTPQAMSAQPIQPAPTHHGMPRQIDDALQVSQVELPPPRYSGPSSEWVNEDKKLG
ncbi:hypothetical protein EsH8_I_001522 [Colletotrichum jinshuiense]